MLISTLTQSRSFARSKYLNKSLTFIMPAYKGDGMKEGQLGPRLAEQFPDSMIIAVYNGVDSADLPQLPPPFVAIWSEPGLRSALDAGYRAYIEGGTDHPLVRTDSDEHPMERFEELADLAVQTGGLVVGDLIYETRTDLMPAESPDGVAQLIWRQMYGQASRSRAPVGCAHGLLVYPNQGVTRQILEHAEVVLRAVDLEANEKVQWGHDGLMILAACAAGVPVTIVPIEGSVERNRPAAKVAQQFSRHYAIVKMAERIFNDRLG